jgi:hypothetical protein
MSRTFCTRNPGVSMAQGDRLSPVSWLSEMLRGLKTPMAGCSQERRPWTRQIRDVIGRESNGILTPI